MEEKWIWGKEEVSRGMWRSGGRGNCDQHSMYERKTQVKKKETVFNLRNMSSHLVNLVEKVNFYYNSALELFVIELGIHLF